MRMQHTYANAYAFAYVCAAAHLFARVPPQIDRIRMRMPHTYAYAHAYGCGCGYEGADLFAGVARQIDRELLCELILALLALEAEVELLYQLTLCPHSTRMPTHI